MLQNLMLRASAAWNPLRVATTEEELEAIYRLRYEIYVAEGGNPEFLERFSDGRVVTPEDSDPATMVFYLGLPSAPEATVRMRCYPAGGIPDEVVQAYSLDLFPDIHTRPTFEANFLMTRRSRRGSLNAVTLLAGAFEKCIRDTGAELLIADCVPGLLTAYRRLGMRTYGGKLIHFGGGTLVPVVGVAPDVEHFRKLRSPLLPISQRLLADGCYANPDIEPLLEVLRKSPDYSKDEQLLLVQESLQETECRFLDRLPKSTSDRLIRDGFLLILNAGDPIVREGFRDREMFLILSGTFQAHIDEHNLDKMEPGELFGEIAFFRESGTRSVSVRCETSGEVLVIRRSLLERLKKESPPDAFAVFEAIAAELAERVGRGPGGDHGVREGHAASLMHCVGSTASSCAGSRWYWRSRKPWRKASQRPDLRMARSNSSGSTWSSRQKIDAALNRRLTIRRIPLSPGRSRSGGRRRLNRSTASHSARPRSSCVLDARRGT